MVFLQRNCFENFETISTTKSNFRSFSTHFAAEFPDYERNFEQTAYYSIFWQNSGGARLVKILAAGTENNSRAAWKLSTTLRERYIRGFYAKFWRRARCVLRHFLTNRTILNWKVEKNGNFKSNFLTSFRLKKALDGLANSKIVFRNSSVKKTLHHNVFSVRWWFFHKWTTGFYACIKNRPKCIKKRPKLEIFSLEKFSSQSWSLSAFKNFLLLNCKYIQFLSRQIFFSKVTSHNWVWKKILPPPKNGAFWGGVEFFCPICQTVS